MLTVVGVKCAMAAEWRLQNYLTEYFEDFPVSWNNFNLVPNYANS